MSRRKSTGGAFPVNPNFLFCSPINDVVLDFCNVVSDVINQLQPELMSILIEHLLEALTNPMQYCLTIDESIIYRARHGLIIVLCFFAFSWRAGKLSVRQSDLVFLNGS